MFGLALRSYQRKVQRLVESGTNGGKTLWAAVLEFVEEEGPAGRERIMQRFGNDDPLAVIAVLTDLVSTGLVYSSGRGDGTVYGVTSDADRRELTGEQAREALAFVLWGIVFRKTGTSIRELLSTTPADEATVRDAVASLLKDGRLTREGDGDDAPLRAATFLIPVGAQIGWEAAVFDHYQACARTIAAKMRQRTLGGAADTRVGGTTLHFGIRPGHPFEERVLGVLDRVRDDLNVLWKEVASYNEAHPTPDDEATRVTFYFGQCVVPPEPPPEGSTDAPSEVTS
jgi:hypothetical protein